MLRAMRVMPWTSACHVLWLLLVTIITSQGCFGIPPPVEIDGEYLANDADYEAIEEYHHSRTKRQTTDLTKFKHYWVTQCGYSKTKPNNTPALEVAATLNTTDEGHLKAAKLIYRMTRFMPPHLFETLATDGSVGVFAVTEVTGDFPEFSYTKNTPECGNSCSGSVCRLTCTSDGRKIDTLAGYGGRRAVVREDNVLCLRSDPYRGSLNVLSHEFAHTINFRALNDSQNLVIRQSFATVGQKWRSGTYATSNYREYFAEAVTSYFLTSLTTELTSGGMNYCGADFCADEWLSRNNLKAKDPDIYALVDEIFTDFRVYLEGRIGVCGW